MPKIKTGKAIHSEEPLEVSSSAIIVSLNNLAARVEAGNAEFADTFEEYRGISTALEGLYAKLRDRARAALDAEQARLDERRKAFGLVQPPRPTVKPAKSPSTSLARAPKQAPAGAEATGKAIADYMRTSKLSGVSKATLANALGLSNGGWAAGIAYAVEHGLVSREGDRRSAVYSPA